MANSLTTNPIVLDTFAADVVISTGRLKVSKILLASAAAGDTLELIDSKWGLPQVRIVNTASPGWDESDFGGFVFENGLTFDQSASTGLGSGDLVFIYLA
jgi:hypothetical protein